MSVAVRVDVVVRLTEPVFVCVVLRVALLVTPAGGGGHLEHEMASTHAILQQLFFQGLQRQFGPHPAHRPPHPAGVLNPFYPMTPCSAVNHGYSERSFISKEEGQPATTTEKHNPPTVEASLRLVFPTNIHRKPALPPFRVVQHTSAKEHAERTRIWPEIGECSNPFNHRNAAV